MPKEKMSFLKLTSISSKKKFSFDSSLEREILFFIYYESIKLQCKFQSFFQEKQSECAGFGGKGRGGGVCGKNNLLPTWKCFSVKRP